MRRHTTKRGLDQKRQRDRQLQAPWGRVHGRRHTTAECGKTRQRDLRHHYEFERGVCCVHAGRRRLHEMFILGGGCFAARIRSWRRRTFPLLAAIHCFSCHPSRAKAVERTRNESHAQCQKDREVGEPYHTIRLADRRRAYQPWRGLGTSAGLGRKCPVLGMASFCQNCILRISDVGRAR